MELHGFNLDDNIYNIIDIQTLNNPDIKLDDYVVVYNNGNIWKYIELDIFQRIPVIYDKYYYFDDNNQESQTFDISICVCPFTLTSSIFRGIYKPSKYILNSCLVLESPNKDLLPIFAPDLTTSDNIIKDVKRIEVKIKTFRNTLSENTDCNFVPIKTTKKHILASNYFNTRKLSTKIKYNNKYHPKTLVYVIQYKSLKSNIYKNTILIGKEANKKTHSGFDSQKSGFTIYIQEMGDKIIDRDAYMVPCLWFAVDLIYPQSKKINIA